jgi:hypothetical protein
VSYTERGFKNKMTTLRRILIVASLTVAVSSLSFATSVEAFATVFPTPPASDPNTDFNYTLTLPDFNLAGQTLTGVTLILYAQESITSVTLTNLGVNTQTTFTATESSEISNNSNDPLVNSATGLKVYSGLNLQVFNSGLLSLGAGTGSNAVGACPEASPGAGCSSVTWLAGDIPNNPDNLIDDPNTGCLATTGCTTGQFVEGYGLNQTSLLADYIGSGTFSLSGATFAENTIAGGGSVAGSIVSTGYLTAEVDYTYTAAGTPEPTTMALMGGALIGLGLIGKRFKRS